MQPNKKIEILNLKLNKVNFLIKKIMIKNGSAQSTPELEKLAKKNNKIVDLINQLDK